MILQSEVRPAPLLSLTEGQLHGPHSLMCYSAEKWDPMFTLNSDPGALRGPIPCQRPCSRSSPAASLGSAGGFAGFAGAGSLTGYQVEVVYCHSIIILSFLKDALLVYDRVIQLSILWNPTPCKEMVKQEEPSFDSETEMLIKDKRTEFFGRTAFESERWLLTPRLGLKPYGVSTYLSLQRKTETTD